MIASSGVQDCRLPSLSVSFAGAFGGSTTRRRARAIQTGRLVEQAISRCSCLCRPVWITIGVIEASLSSELARCLTPCL